METGMLWYDNDPKTTLTDKVARAVEYYRKKYGRDPNLCLVNPGSFPNGEEKKATNGSDNGIVSGKVAVRSYRPVLPGHLWIGIEDKN